MNKSEEQSVSFESARHDAMSKYFKARPQLLRTIKEEQLFCSGFKMAWELYNEPSE